MRAFSGSDAPCVAGTSWASAVVAIAAAAAAARSVHIRCIPTSDGHRLFGVDGLPEAWPRA
jgi:hypothetical protein